MGNICSLSLCCAPLCVFCKPDKKEYRDHLIRERHCSGCQYTYLSNYEYNRHIVECNRMYGDL